MKTPWVVKIGGRLCEDAVVRSALARACAAIDGDQPLVIVHGGGAQVTKLQDALGIVPRFEDGRRVTAPGEVHAVEMALSGAVNKTLVRALRDANRSAVGVSGVDAAMVRCDLVPGLGAVGAPRKVDTTLIHQLLGAGYVVVLSPVSLGPADEPVNVNADELACAVAEALGAARLLLLSDVPGVAVGGETQEVVLAEAVEELIAAHVATGGMIPKLRAAAKAVRGGVGEVRIAGFSGELLASGGTVVRPAASAPGRAPARAEASHV